MAAVEQADYVRRLATVRLIAVGDVMVDVVCDRLPEPGTRLHGGVSLRAGGSAVNAALAAAEIGAGAAVVGRVGADAAGDVVAATLEARGVELHLARDNSDFTACGDISMTAPISA